MHCCHSHLLVFGPGHLPYPTRAIGYLICVYQRVVWRIGHLLEVVAKAGGFYDAALFGDDHRPVLRYPFLLAVFVICQNDKYLWAVINAHVLAGVAHILNVVIGQLYAVTTDNAVPER